jgi:hypothetical protein
MIDKRVLFGGFGLVLLALFLLRNKLSTETQYNPATKVQGLPQLSYIVPPVEIIPGGSIPHGALFDWFNGEQCGCGDVAQNALIIYSTVISPRALPSYSFIPNIDLSIPPALKGAPSLFRSDPMPAPITYQAPTPTFWWGWQGLSRVIYTSDSMTLSMATQDKGGMNRAATMQRLWKDVTPGRNALTPITAIEYDGQVYQLDARRSTGL